MAEVTSLSSDRWTTTAKVKQLVQIPQKGSQQDHETAIERATDSVQAWYKRETGQDSLPDVSNLDDLVVQATSYMAAHESHFSFSWNYRNSDRNDNTGPASARDMAKSKFREWADQRDVTDSEADTDGAMAAVPATSGALIDEF
jgi:hypothetical protein